MCRASGCSLTTRLSAMPLSSRPRRSLLLAGQRQPHGDDAGTLWPCAEGQTSRQEPEDQMWKSFWLCQMQPQLMKARSYAGLRLYWQEQ